MCKQRIVLVAGDAAPSGAFEQLGETLQGDPRSEVVKYLCIGKPNPFADKEVIGTVSKAEIAILGMSSSDTMRQVELLAAVTARYAGIPYGFYGDIVGCWRRARLFGNEQLLNGVSFYFGIDQKDADEAKETFPNARCFGTGNPLRDQMAVPPRITREEVRGKLGIAEGEIVVLAPGGTFPEDNIVIWTILVEALNTLSKWSGKKYRLILSVHPGDRLPFQVDGDSHKSLGLYERLVMCVPDSVSTTLLMRGNKFSLSTPDVVAGCDIVVDNGTSITLCAAYQRKPCITFQSWMAARQLELINGMLELEAVLAGISSLVSPNPNDLAKEIEFLCTTHGFAGMQAKQDVFCQPKEKGESVRRMIEAILPILAG